MTTILQSSLTRAEIDKLTASAKPDPADDDFDAEAFRAELTAHLAAHHADKYIL
jgi:hypothetical protein